VRLGWRLFFSFFRIVETLFAGSVSTFARWVMMEGWIDEDGVADDGATTTLFVCPRLLVWYKKRPVAFANILRRWVAWVSFEKSGFCWPLYYPLWQPSYHH